MVHTIGPIVHAIMLQQCFHTITFHKWPWCNKYMVICSSESKHYTIKRLKLDCISFQCKFKSTYQTKLCGKMYHPIKNVLVWLQKKENKLLINLKTLKIWYIYNWYEDKNCEIFNLWINTTWKALIPLCNGHSYLMTSCTHITINGIIMHLSDIYECHL